MNYKFKTKCTKLLSDLFTPVEVYLKIRDTYPNSFLLESSDYKSKENSFSYLCFNPIAEFKVDQNQLLVSYPNSKMESRSIDSLNIAEELNSFVGQFETEELHKAFATNGLFGYTSYDAIPLFQPIEFQSSSIEIPLIQYHLFKNLIVFNHFNNELYIVENLLAGEESETEMIKNLLANRAIHQFKFEKDGVETSNVSDEEYLENVKAGIQHCHRGDVFQVVLSRKFKQGFKGDEFNVYRALRSVNPSPYLFYFD
ncbi:chorismate-binding protein, partial [uncultured Algoriphagus sp.]|uniref:chorismate-binding protein n=1 Tax=uncultured Algoriphagus sp. TaxID=417365 RepID=UPI002598D076